MSMPDTLVLDSNWTPQHFTTWDNAVKLIYEGRAQVIKEDEAGKQLRSPSFTMGMPRVIVVRNAWVRRKREAVPCTRSNLYLRDGGECQYTGHWETNGGSKYWVDCGEFLQTHEYTLDHVLPRVQGGLSTWDNLVVACVACNKAKAGMTPAQAGMTLRHRPVEPGAADPRFNFKLHINKLRPEWKEWSSWLYWNITLDK
jgi:5-methylcytosine-specific restriction endonuclease McrA